MEFRLEKEALFASGIREQSRVALYKKKIGLIYQQFTLEITVIQDRLTKAKVLFDWLWKQKPHRYRSHGYYRLSDVIDSQMSPGEEPVGNCLGLTALYNCLLKRAGLNAEALHLENAFGKGPHVLTVLRIEESLIDIENILPDGFDSKRHLKDPSRTRWGDKELVADIYHSRGTESFARGDYGEALKNFERAVSLNPRYEKARINRVIVLDRMGMDKKIDHLPIN